MTSLIPHHPICWAGSHLKGLESVWMFGNEFWLFCGPAWHQRGLQMHSYTSSFLYRYSSKVLKYFISNGWLSLYHIPSFLMLRVHQKSSILMRFWWLWHGIITHCGPEDYPGSLSLLIWAHKNGFAAIQKQWMTSLNPHHPICWAGSHRKGLESLWIFSNEFWWLWPSMTPKRLADAFIDIFILV